MGFSFASAKGTVKLAISNGDIANIPSGEAHLGIELTIGNRTYFTGVTFFEKHVGNYCTTM